MNSDIVKLISNFPLQTKLTIEQGKGESKAVLYTIHRALVTTGLTFTIMLPHINQEGMILIEQLHIMIQVVHK